MCHQTKVEGRNHTQVIFSSTLNTCTESFNFFTPDVRIFVCLGFLSYSRFCHSYGDITIIGEGLQILTYARHLRPLSSEGSGTVTRGIRL